jgi:hypothetical protein
MTMMIPLYRHEQDISHNFHPFTVITTLAKQQDISHSFSSVYSQHYTRIGETTRHFSQLSSVYSQHYIGETTRHFSQFFIRLQSALHWRNNKTFLTTFIRLQPSIHWRNNKTFLTTFHPFTVSTTLAINITEGKYSTDKTTSLVSNVTSVWFVHTISVSTFIADYT